MSRALVWPVNAAEGAIASTRLWRNPHTTAQKAASFLVLVQPPKGTWPVGIAVQGRLERAGAEESGYRVPSEAVVYAAGAAWIYQQAGAGTFVRRPISTDLPDGEDGWIVPERAIVQSQPVVVAGAQALLAQETLQSMGGAEE